MTNELKAVLEKIDGEFKEYFKDDSDVKTIFVAGSMAHDDYQDRADNDYDIRVISEGVTKEKLEKFENFLRDLSKYPKDSCYFVKILDFFIEMPMQICRFR